MLYIYVINENKLGSSTKEIIKSLGDIYGCDCHLIATIYQWFAELTVSKDDDYNRGRLFHQQ